MMTTIKDLVKEHNALARECGTVELAGWKQSAEKLRERIEAMRSADAQVCADPLALPADTETVQSFDDAEAHTPSAEAPKVTMELRIEPAEAPEPSTKPWTIGAAVRELLLDPAGYDYAFIVEAVRREFPTANTSSRSVASVAAALRRDGAVFPMRRKPRKSA